MNLSGHHISTAALAPVLLFQGLSCRHTVRTLPEPPGERVGASGRGKQLRLLVLGDSAAAGVGAGHQRDALGGQITRALSDQFDVHWKVFASAGETTKSTLSKLQRLSPEEFDVVVTSLGVNDVTSGVTVKRWLTLQSQLRSRLRTELGIRRVVVSSVPLMARFPALPQPLRWHLGARAKLFNRMLVADLADEADCTYLPIDSIEDIDLMAEDGFHPGPQAYSIWGNLAADVIKNELM